MLSLQIILTEKSLIIQLFSAIWKGWKLVLLFVLLFRRWIKIGSQRIGVFVCNCSTIVTPKKALFDVISLLGDLVIAYRTNLVVIVPKAFRTFHDQCRVHIRVFAMFTGTFRVKGGGRFTATTFCFLTLVFSVFVALLGASSLNAILRSHFLLLLLIFNIRWTLLISTLVIGSIFYISVAFFPFLLNDLTTFCSWLNLFRFLTLQVHLETYSAHQAW